MDSGLMERVKEFRISAAVAREMLSTGLISKEEYAMVCTKIAENCGLQLSTIFSEIDLQGVEPHGNIHY